MDNYDRNTIEKKWREIWAKSSVYAWDKDGPKENMFVIDTPPPYASGTLHMGHIFGFVQADVVARYQRQRGKNVFFTIGFDDNGLPTERTVEKEIGRRASSMPRYEFRSLCLQVIEKIEANFIEAFKQTALSIDWSQVYRTIDDRCTTISQMSFIDLYEKGLVHRTLQPTIWDTVDQTALAQADLEDKEMPGIMHEIKFQSEDGKDLIIASTRPEMLPACVALLYHPTDQRYQSLQNKFAIVPLCGHKVPIIADEQVQLDKGTGLVMCCTFGDIVDIEWWRRHNLATRIMLDVAGRISLKNIDRSGFDSEVLERIEQKKINEARLIMAELLDNRGLLLNKTNVTRMVKCAERSKSVVEILLVPQWSIKVLQNKDLLLEKSKECAWHPDYMKHRIFSWIEGLNWDWCISRQRYFGVPFPVWYSKRPGEEGKVLLPAIEQLPIDPEKDLPRGYNKDEVMPEMDVMDTWATSSLTPQINAKGIGIELCMDANRYTKLFPADLRFQGHEIIRTWAFYTIAKAAMHSNSIPWHNIMINGWVLAADKSKMSKSLGNVTTPAALFETRGVDAVRYWASSYSPGTDVALTKDAFDNGERLLKKLWNAAKFVYGHIKERTWSVSNVTASTDLWIMSKLHLACVSATKSLDEFDYLAARNAVETFFWKDFCDNYLELIKTRIYDNDNKNPQGKASAIATSAIVMKTLVKLFAPFMPHITEEIYSVLYVGADSIHKQGNWPDANEVLFDESKMLLGEIIVQILAEIRKFKTEEKISLKAEIDCVNINCHTIKDFSKNVWDDVQNACCIKALSFNENIGRESYKVYSLDNHELTIQIYK